MEQKLTVGMKNSDIFDPLNAQYQISSASLETPVTMAFAPLSGFNQSTLYSSSNYSPLEQGIQMNCDYEEPQFIKDSQIQAPYY
jgi:hypothetical protein